jgi:hypothetical protein
MFPMKLIALGLLMVLASGCVVRSYDEPDSRRVVVADAPPTGDCFYVGEAIGEDRQLRGESAPSVFMSDRAMDDLRSDAYRIGGNYVAIAETRSGTSAGLTYVTHIGSAYSCRWL